MRLGFIIFRYLLAVASTALLLSEGQLALAAAPRLNTHVPAAHISGQIRAIADFDGDLKLDYVTTHPGGDGYRISVWLSARTEVMALGLTAAPAGSMIHTCDINRDSFLDIIVAGPATPHPLQVWLGNGRGRFEAGDQDQYWCDSRFVGVPSIHPVSTNPSLDLIAESSNPDFDGILLAVEDTNLTPHAFIPESESVRTLQILFFSAVPRSPPCSISIV